MGKIRDNKLIIAIDGYSSCGKSTFAKSIATELGCLYIDSGAMYRALTLYGIRTGLVTKKKIQIPELICLLGTVQIDFRKNSSGKYETYLNDENVENDIRSVEVSDCVSSVSVIKEVRAHLVAIQRIYGKSGSVVMDGRDIGTVVFPDADIKIFMTAKPEIRARRRYDELTAKGLLVNFKDILKNVRERDLLDSTRKESPLTKAEDAIVLDNSYMTPDEQMIWFRNIVDHNR